MNEEQFFKYLREKTDLAFQKSQIKYKQDRKNRSWNYSICATPIQQKKGILFGLNWGGDGEYESQTKMPTATAINDNPGANKFIYTLLPNLRKYFNLNSISEINYSNLCFFRSPKISDLKNEDWELSLPLFIEFCEFINPPWIIFTSISKSQIERLKRLNSKKSDLIILGEQFSIKQGDKEFIGYKKGKFNNTTDFYVVPHPGTQLWNESRKKIWEKASSVINN